MRRLLIRGRRACQTSIAGCFEGQRLYARLNANLSTRAWDHDKAEEAFAKDIKPHGVTIPRRRDVVCYILNNLPHEDVGLVCVGPNKSRRRGRVHGEGAAVKGGAGRADTDAQRVFVVQARGRGVR